MNIKEITAAFKAERRGISFAFLAERTETSADSPYRIKPAETVRPDETLVCVIGGSGGKGDHIREYNGYLKQTDTFVKKRSGTERKTGSRLCGRLQFRRFSS